MFLKVILVLAASLCISCSAQDSDLNVTLFYEGLCPYCHNFIVDQLYPGYQKLGDSFKLDVVPYGWETYKKLADGTIQYTCQHGENECTVNRIHACVIDQNPTQSDLISFMQCHLSQASAYNIYEELMDMAKDCSGGTISFDRVQNCVEGSHADELLMAYSERQSKLYPALPFVPNIRFNGVYDTELEDEATKDFFATICKVLKDNKPEVCG
ncbi:gamma-interferon-inducible lysosomal thiol reductase-like [Diabrotica virgifera virgifera]|uniref:Gamma-interferon-inducible lysosomal thiol reductase-like n=1 Tax=Diabrotica virgifera virgifera TaxID=50390 RepID=A0A6P7GS75_DIAVI|nr:gamma-interferon-inducible lysosomal thiol reductase-like [Diabrotica virgifera virgifera]